MSEVFDISFACPFFLPVQSFSCFSPILSRCLSLSSLWSFLLLFLVHSFGSLCIFVACHLFSLYLQWLGTTLDRKSWSLSFFVSPFLTMYTNLFSIGWRCLVAAVAAVVWPRCCCRRHRCCPFFFLLFHSKTNRKIKFNLLEMLWKRSQMRVHKSETNEWKETQRCKPTRQ